MNASANRPRASAFRRTRRPPKARLETFQGRGFGFIEAFAALLVLCQGVSALRVLAQGVINVLEFLLVWSSTEKRCVLQGFLRDPFLLRSSCSRTSLLIGQVIKILWVHISFCS